MGLVIVGGVAARAGKSWKDASGGHYDVLKPFLEPIDASVNSAAPRTTADGQFTACGGR